MTRVAWLTDIHLNFLDESRRETFYRALAAGPAEALLLTGDIAESNTIVPLLHELAGATERPTYFVLGNHDFYRGSIGEVRARVVGLSEGWPRLTYLTAAGVVSFGANTALVGHDGWADGRLGDFDGSRVLLNDYMLIEELRQWRNSFTLDRPALRRELERLAAEAVAHLAQVLPEALARHRRVVVATHVPPFAEACCHAARYADEQWLPHFCSQTLGDFLRKTAAEHPDREILVLCGHTHAAAEVQMGENLRVLTGGAEYSHPAVQRMFDWD